MEAKIITRSENSRLFDDVKFVIAARAKVSTRYTIKQIFIEKDCVVATDGIQLHISYGDTEKLLKVPCGLYDVREADDEIILLKYEGDSKFPKYQDITPTSYTQHFEVTIEKLRGYSNSGIPNLLYGLYKKDIGVNLKYLESLPNTTWDVWFNRPDQPIMLKAENKLALIMPSSLSETNYITEEPAKAKTKGD